jgi:type III restriction enzyme
VDKKADTDSKLSDKKEGTSTILTAYTYYVEQGPLLDRDRKVPVRFIFSHSALREGWDNPNVSRFAH